MKLMYGGRPVGKAASEQHAHRKRRIFVPNRIVQLEIEKPLVVIHLRGIGQPCATHPRERALVAVERTVRGKRDARIRHVVARQPLVTFEKHDAVRDLIRRLSKRRIDIRHRQIAGAVFRKVRVGNREQRHADEHLQLIPLRLHVALHGNFVGNIVCDENGLQRQSEHQGCGAAKNSDCHEVTVKIV